MELRILLHLLRRYALTILLPTVVSVLAAALWLSQRPPLYNAHISVVSGYQADKPKTSEAYFEYNNFYGTEVAKAFNESISGRLKNESFVSTIIRAADVKPTVGNNLGKYFRTTAKGSHVSEIRFQAEERSEIEAIAQELATRLHQEAAAFSATEGEGRISLSLAGPNITQQQPLILLYLVIIALVFAGLSVLLVIGWAYARGFVMGADAIADRLGVPVITSDGKSTEGLLSIREFALQMPANGQRRIGVLSPAGLAQANWLESWVRLVAEAKGDKSIVKFVLLPTIASPELSSLHLDTVDAVVICLDALATTSATLNYLDTLLGYCEHPLGLVTV